MESTSASITREHILAIEAQLLSAIKTSDVNTLDVLLHNDLLFMVPGGHVITKQMDLESHKSGTMIVEEAIPTIESVQMFGDTAVVALSLQTKGSMMGQPIAGIFRYIRVWKLMDGQLKVIGGSCVKL